MAEASSTTKVPRAEYLKIEPTKSNGSGTGPDSPFYIPPEAPTRPRVTAIEEVPRGGTSDQLVEAAGAFLRMLRAEIAHHEGELRKLREVLSAFAAVAPQQRQNAASGELSEGDRALIQRFMAAHGEDGGN